MNPYVERDIQVGNLCMHVRSWGEGGVPVVLLHGLASTGHIWDLVVPKLSESFRVCVPDQRGHSLSDKPLTGYSFKQMRTDLEQLLLILELDTVLLVGHSWGADVALDFAAHFPERVLGLCLVDGGMIDLQSRQTWEEAKLLLTPPNLEHWSSKELSEAFPKWFGAAWQSQFLPIVMASFDTKNDRVVSRLPLAQHMEIVRALWEQRSYELYPGLHCPTTMMVAVPPKSHDVSAELLVAWRKEGLDVARKTIRNLRAVILENSIHDIPLQHPAHIVKEIEKLSKIVNSQHGFFTDG